MSADFKAIASDASAPAREGLQRLGEILLRHERVLIGYSGGIDSAFLLWAAVEALGRDRVLAVTGISPSLAAEQLDQAERTAAEIGAHHRLLPTYEAENPNYLSNSPDRCYHCKHELYSRLRALAAKEGYDAVLDGSNLDDTRDVRPGFRATDELQILSPLLLAGLGKAAIRELSRAAGLSAWDRPASPCLSSRVPHGTPITSELLTRIERGEAFLRTLVSGAVRLRSHGEHARIEAEPSQIPVLQQASTFARVREQLESLGYSTVTVDPRGYRQGGADLPTPR